MTDSRTLHDIAKVWKISDDHMDYALIKYAMKNPSKAAYGYVYDKRNEQSVTNKQVLISKENFDYNKYYYI